MTTIRTRIKVAPDGTLVGQALGLPAGEHEAQVTLIDRADRPVGARLDILLARVRAIQEEVAQLPVLDDRSPDQILGYDERGHFG